MKIRMMETNYKAIKRLEETICMLTEVFRHPDYQVCVFTHWEDVTFRVSNKNRDDERFVDFEIINHKLRIKKFQGFTRTEAFLIRRDIEE